MTTNNLPDLATLMCILDCKIYQIKMVGNSLSEQLKGDSKYRYLGMRGNLHYFFLKNLKAIAPRRFYPSRTSVNWLGFCYCCPPESLRCIPPEAVCRSPTLCLSHIVKQYIESQNGK